MEYILGCIKAKPLFATISIEPKKYWEHLLWMDAANKGGVPELTVEAPRGSKRRQIIDDNDESQGKWKLS
jgi:hypothetical protein